MQLARRATQGRLTTLDRLWTQPELILHRAGLTPDRWQTGVLRTRKAQTLLLCSRQAGKTLVAAAQALRTALLEAPALVLVLTPSERQSSEFMRRVKELHEALRRPTNVAGRVLSYYEKQAAEAEQDDLYFRMPEKTRESTLQLHLDNGSRIIGLPASEGKVRVYSSVALLVVDEASRVDDALYSAMRPMLAVSRGRLLAAVDALRPARLVPRGLARRRRLGAGQGNGRAVPAHPGRLPRARAAGAGRTLVPARVPVQFRGRRQRRVRLRGRPGGLERRGGALVPGLRPCQSITSSVWIWGRRATTAPWPSWNAPGRPSPTTAVGG